ncbi:MAG TPA: YXWGXW repeat-containing protein [Gemmataceae bacterium]|nr:YXWGXW repeat-containing protein [Gemmataceae bacterium]
MGSQRVAIVLAFLGLGSGFEISTGYGQPPPDAAPVAQADGTEVLASGPIHEAYAEPVDTKPQPTSVVPKQPPDSIQEIPPDQKPAGENVQWIPGYWSWDIDRNDFIWVSGVWRVPPPDQQWMPGYWNQVNGGWQWVPGFWNTGQQDQVQYLPPPPEALQAAASTPAPDPNSVFVPGTWVYVVRDSRYAWRPGYWVDYRPGWVWIPAHYYWTPVGYVFVDGHWDYELNRRGLMFAPVFFRDRIWLRPGWFYRPDYAVYPDYAMSCLFVCPGSYSYYFGDYYAAAYAKGGFVPWLDFRLGRVGYDPLFAYYRWAHRDNPRWIADLRTVYAGRLKGTLPRPPRTILEQTTLIRNLRAKNANVALIENMTAVAPLSKIGQKFVRLETVSREEQARDRVFARQIIDASRERNRVAVQLIKTGKAPLRVTDRPQFARVQLPKAEVSVHINEGREIHGGAVKIEERKPGTFTPDIKIQPRTELKLQPKLEVHRPLPPPRPDIKVQPRHEEKPEPKKPGEHK